jgi:hypothetical protein
MNAYRTYILGGIAKMFIAAIAEKAFFFSDCFSALAYTVSGTTYLANGSVSDVQAAVSAARNGSTVIISNGRYTWTRALSISKFVSLQAATPGRVTIAHNNPGGDLIDLVTNSAGHSIIAGVRFLPGTANNSSNYISVSDRSSPDLKNGPRQPAGGAQFAIMYDCTFNVPDSQLRFAIDWMSTGGLIYNCTFTSTTDGGSSGPGCGSGCLRVESNYPWYNVSTFGNVDTDGSINCYIENCTFHNFYNQAVDCDDNARVVVRYCTIVNSQMVTHGVTSRWGGRQVELYRNSFNYVQEPPNSAGITWVNLNRYFWFRAGTARIWGNKVMPIFSGRYWNAGGSWVFIDEPLTRPGAGNGGVCETEAEYPGTRWPGTGSNGTTQYRNTQRTGVVVTPSFVDPVYIWDNTDVPGAIPGGVKHPSAWWGTNDQPGDGCASPGRGHQTADVFRLNRDIFIEVAPTGYTPYVYPHPLNARTGVASRE